MSKISFKFADRLRTFEDVESHREELLRAVNIRFSPEKNNSYDTDFSGMSHNEIKELEKSILDEISFSSVFALLSCVEAILRADFIIRCQLKKKDNLSKAYLRIFKSDRKFHSYRLNEDIIENWIAYRPKYKEILNYFKDAFSFRHWYAHGRYWQFNNNTRKFNFENVLLNIERFKLAMDADLKKMTGVGDPLYKWSLS